MRYLWDAHDGVQAYNGDGCFYMQGGLRSAYRSVCTIEKWSSWKSKNENLSMLEASLANGYAISSNGIVHDLLPLVNQERGNNVTRLACGYDVAFLAEGELRNHHAHCRKLPKRAPALNVHKVNWSNKLILPKGAECEHKHILVVPGSEILALG